MYRLAKLIVLDFRLLHLYNNPWHCTCRLRWLRVWIEAAKITYDFDSEEKVTRLVSISPPIPPARSWDRSVWAKTILCSCDSGFRALILLLSFHCLIRCSDPRQLRSKTWWSLDSDRFACAPILYSDPHRVINVHQGGEVNFTCRVYLDPPKQVVMVFLVMVLL